MSFHRELNAANPEVVAQATEMTLNPNLPVELSHSMRVAEDYPCFQAMIGVLQERYVEIAQSSGMDEEYAHTLLAGSLVAINAMARFAELSELQASFEL